MATTPKAPADPIDSRLVRKLADILTDTGLTEIEVEHGALKIRVVRAPATVAYAHRLMPLRQLPPLLQPKLPRQKRQRPPSALLATR
jgi:hypothetical protein